jgi:hypothetical protein
MVTLNALTSLMSSDGQRRTWLLAGQPITSIVLGYHVALRFSWGPLDAPTYGEITIEAPFKVGGTTIDPQNRETLQPVLELLHEPVDSVSADEAGSLEVRLGNGRILTVQKTDDPYEKWNTNGTGELHDFNMLCSAHDGPPWRA